MSRRTQDLTLQQLYKGESDKTLILMAGCSSFLSLPLWALRDEILCCKTVALTNFMMDSRFLKCKRGKAQTCPLTNSLFFFVNS